MTAIYKGDSTASFGSTFLTIKLNNPEGYVIKKAQVKIGNLPVITFLPETGATSVAFPLKINLTSVQTRQLQAQNTCYLAVWDTDGNKATCKGTVKFVAKDEVVR